MRKLMLILAGAAWLRWPGNAHAFSLGCELPGADVEKWKPPEEWDAIEYCSDLGCDLSWSDKEDDLTCRETGKREYHWWIVNCVVIGGVCYEFWGGPRTECQELGGGGWGPW